MPHSVSDSEEHNRRMWILRSLTNNFKSKYFIKAKCHLEEETRWDENFN